MADFDPSKLDVLLTKADFSDHIWACLRGADLRTPRRILERLGDPTNSWIPGFGKRSRKTVLEFIEDLCGYTLGMELPPAAPSLEDSIVHNETLVVSQTDQAQPYNTVSYPVTKVELSPLFQALQENRLEDGPDEKGFEIQGKNEIGIPFDLGCTTRMDAFASWVASSFITDAAMWDIEVYVDGRYLKAALSCSSKGDSGSIEIMIPNPAQEY